MTFRYFRKQRLGVVQMGHVPPYITNGGRFISPYFVIGGMYTGAAITIDPTGPAPAVLPAAGGSYANYTAYIDKTTLDLVWCAYSVPGTSTSTRNLVVPIGSNLFSMSTYAVSGTTDMLFYNEDGTLGGTYVNPANNDVAIGLWTRYSDVGVVGQVSSFVESYPATLQSIYNYYTAATRDETRVIQISSIYRSTATTAGVDDTYYGKGQAAEQTFERPLRGGMVIGRFDLTDLDTVAPFYDVVLYSGTLSTNAMQILPLSASRQIRNDEFAFCGYTFLNSVATEWTFNSGRASALTYPRTHAALSKAGWVTKYTASDLVVQWWVQLDNGGASGSLFTPTDYAASGSSSPYTVGLAQLQSTHIAGCDITDSGDVVACGGVVDDSGNAIIRSQLGILMTTAIPVVAGTNLTHGVLFKLNSDATAVDWFQIIEARVAANYQCGSRSVIVREDLDAVFVLGDAGTTIRFYETAGNAGNAYAVGGTTVDRVFNNGSAVSSTGWWVARYKLSTGAFEWVFTGRSSGIAGTFSYASVLQFLPNSFTDLHDGILVAMNMASSSPAQTLEIDPEGPAPTNFGAQLTSRSYLVKLSYDGVLMASKSNWSTPNSYAISSMPVTTVA